MHLLTRKRTSTAVILAGGETTRLHPLTGLRPICLFPVFNRPLIEHTIGSLTGTGINNIIIASSPEKKTCSEIERLRKNNGVRVNIEYAEDSTPKGTAGVLRSLRAHIDDEDFLVINGGTFLGNFDIQEMLSFHCLKGSYLTVGVKKVNAPPQPEGISVADDGQVKVVTRVHPSKDRRSGLRPAGLYVFRSEALEHIDKGYFDIKEQLVQALRELGLPSYAFALNGDVTPIETLDDYYEVHRALFETTRPQGMEEIAEGVWAPRDVHISPKSYILGPVVIGEGSRIEDHAQIIGPAVLGKGCVLRKGALVRESILWEGVEAGERSGLAYCIVSGNLKVSPGASHQKKAVVKNMRPADVNLARGEFVSASLASDKTAAARHMAHLALKRLEDIIFSLVAITILSPLMLVIALLIKLDSPGPVIFSQRRCTRGGREFGMLKFRTMSQGADRLQKEYASRKNVDGPVFKLVNDPRVTRVGRVLRRTSLDELPQFFNVLKGEMSLVGPRPLVMGEMRFSPSWRDARLRVKPGVTGLWQITGRSNSSFHDWILYDIFYVRKMSFWLDLKILAKTPWAVLKKTGAF